LDHIDYGGFGQVSSESSPSNGDRYKFTAREFDSELSGASLAYYRARFYRFDVGEWQSEDPLRFGAGDSNLYRYVGNHAANATDPSGMLTGFGLAVYLMFLGLSSSNSSPTSEWARSGLTMLRLGATLPEIIDALGPMPFTPGGRSQPRDDDITQ